MFRKGSNSGEHSSDSDSSFTDEKEKIREDSKTENEQENNEPPHRSALEGEELSQKEESTYKSDLGDVEPTLEVIHKKKEEIEKEKEEEEATENFMDIQRKFREEKEKSEPFETKEDIMNVHTTLLQDEENKIVDKKEYSAGEKDDKGSEESKEDALSRITELPHEESMSDTKEVGDGYRQHMLQFVNRCFSNKYIKGEPTSIYVGYVRLNWLRDISDSQRTPLPQCKECRALLNSLSQVDLEAKKWNCEFCGNVNNCDVKAPKLGTTLETLGECSVVENKMKVILCIDISPSMNKTIVLEEYSKGHSKRNTSYLKKDGGSDYVSYWSKVQSAACNLLNNICVDFPNTIVGVIFFSSNLLIYGDSAKKPVDIRDKKVNGENLFENEKLLSEAIKKSTKGFMTTPISETREKLIYVIKSIRPEEGQTALGPTLLAANILLEGDSKGSHIVVLTDGGSNYGFGYLQDKENVDKQFYKDIAKKFKKKGVIVSIFAFGTAPCSLSDLTVLSRETQGLMSRYEVPIETPVITLPAYVQEISDISIQVIASKDILLRCISDLSSEPSSKNRILNKRTVMLLNSIFYFEYELAPESSREAPKSFPVQIQIEYKKNHNVLRRTATEYVLMMQSPPKENFNEYDVLVKYGVKSATYALSESKLEDSALILEVLRNILKMLNANTKESAKKKDCIAKINAAIKDILNKCRDDKRISKMIEEATVDNFFTKA